MNKTVLFFALAALPNLASPISDDDFFKLLRALRQVDSHTVKSAAADYDESQSQPSQETNGDYLRYADLRGTFGKSLRHFSSGFIDPSAFESLFKAINTGKNSDFNQIQLGTGTVKLTSPQAALSYSLTGNDAWLRAILPAPTFASAETAGEMVELYWTVLTRDTAFNAFSGNPDVISACANLTALSDFNGPRIGGAVTPATYLRGSLPGCLTGPYISQFLYQDLPFGALTVPPTQRVPTAGIVNDFNYTFADWFTVANGGATGNTTTYDIAETFIRNSRDLAEYVHLDTPGQAGLTACLILASYGTQALDPNNPYFNNPTQIGFVTYGISQILEMCRVAAHDALKAAWYHKWLFNLRLRPEEYGFYLDLQLSGGADLGIHPDLTGSPSLPLIQAMYGSYLLPVAYPEGSPSHPSYPSGHATFTAAAVTVLKAFFNEDFIIPNPLEPNLANNALVPYGGPPLTVGGELNKLAANIGIGRDSGGVHYRSDAEQGFLLGEQIAIDILNNEAFLNNEDFPGFSLTKFDGTRVTVGAKKKL